MFLKQLFAIGTMLVLSFKNMTFPRATIRPIVPRHKHSIIIIKRQNFIRLSFIIIIITITSIR